MERIKSPITERFNTKIIKTYKREYFIDLYKPFKIDVSSYFEGNSLVYFVKCKDTGLKFFYPDTIAGDGIFYEKLQEFDWYYMPWKWEHEKAYNLIKPHSKVLEIGCAEGHFLHKLKTEKKCDCYGLEINNKAFNIAQEKEIKVYKTPINLFAQEHKEEFDVICSFQVLEHISNVKEFLNDQIACLKKGGILIISVPNNNSFIKYDAYNSLNKPPHHLGLWTKYSLSKLGSFLNIKPSGYYYEPMQKYHIDWFIRILNDKINKIWGIRTLYFRLKIVYLLKPLIKFCKGHTILYTFEKTKH
ncbi:MAG: class I SAM-dependent methyltransferase [Endomicrobiia bacterium]